MKTQVKRIIDGVERTITVNPKYAGTSRKPVNVESSARKFIVGGVLPVPAKRRSPEEQIDDNR